MSPFKSILAVLAIGLSSVAVATPVAVAQATAVIVVDHARVRRDSKAGQDIQTKVSGIEGAMTRELQPAADALTTERNALAAVMPEGATTEALLAAAQSDPALQTQVTNYAINVRKFEMARQLSSQDLALTERVAWNEYSNALLPVLQAVVDESGAQIMIDRAGVTFAAESVDMTDAVIVKMDAATPTITVVRQKVPVQPAPPAQ